MNILIDIFQFAEAVATLFLGLIIFAVLLSIAYEIVNLARRRRGREPMASEDFIRTCGMTPAPDGWPFRKRKAKP